MSYSKGLSHIVFITKDRKPVLLKSGREELFKYISKIIVNRKSVPIKINGVEDHIHILCDVHPSEPISELVKTIKIASNKMIKQSGLFPEFESWQKGYASFSVSESHLPAVAGYINRQEEHHHKTNSKDELIRLLKVNRIEYDEKYII